MRSRLQRKILPQTRRSVDGSRKVTSDPNCRRVRLLNPIKLRALAYARAGYAVIPLFEPMRSGGCTCPNPECGRIGKHPRTRHGVRDATTDLKTIEDWWTRWPNANIGIATGAPSDIIVVDLDGDEAVAAFLQMSQIASLPSRATVKTARGFHVYYRRGDLQIGNSAGQVAPGIDIRGDGGYVVAHGSRHASGEMYRLAGWSLSHRMMVPEKAPDWLASLAKPAPRTPRLAETVRETAYGAKALQDEITKLLTAPEHHRNDSLNRSAFKLGQLCADGLLTEAAVVDAFKRVALVIGLKPKEIDATIRSGLSSGLKNPRSVNAKRADQGGDVTPVVGDVTPGEDEEDLHANTLAKLPNTDAGNAERLATRHRDKLLWTPGARWHRYNGKIWAPDAKMDRVTLALDTAKKIADEADHTDDRERRSFALKSQSKGALDRMLGLAQTFLAKDDKLLDADPWRLAVENGVLALQSGDLLPHDPTYLITKTVPTAYDAGAVCPRFESFLRHALSEDEDVITFLQKAVGMSLTGIVRDQVFFMLEGRGSTGKSTFLNLIRDMLGGYGVHTAVDTWTTKRGENATQPDLVRLKGARMVTSIEANFDQRLDEAKLKGVTGGEPVTCRGLYQNTFEYVPQFKLWFAVNDFPGVRSTADSFWRRARVIRFDVQVDKAEIDRDLDCKLRTELPGILAWAVRGCLAWQREGLTPPAAVVDATAGWQKKVDHLTLFVRDSLIRDPGGPGVQSSFVIDHYRDWCGRHGEKALSPNKFTPALKAEGFEHTRVDGRSFWKGLRLRIE